VSGWAQVRHVASPVREQTVEIIRNQIMDGTLQAGQRLVERELCERLDISRNTLREAYRQLEAEGFVEIRPHKGPTVRRISAREARSLYELRQALEGLAIRMFTQRASDEQMRQLARAFDELKAAHHRGSVSDMLRCKNVFYDVLYRGADNDVLRDHARLLQGRLAQLRARSLSSETRPRQSIEEIEGVLGRIIARDAPAAEAAWARHIHSAYLVVERVMAETPAS
jgi:DNA-binding GntR family transcriptional regulator